MRTKHCDVTRMLLLAVLVGTGGVARGQDFSQVEITTTHVRGGIYMLQGAGGNIGVSSGEDGLYLIDDQFAPLTEKIRAALEEIGEGPLRFVFNTHWHGDHTGGNENLGEAGVLIVAHENVRQRMSVDQFIEAFDREIPAAPQAALPDVTFTSEVTFHLNGETAHAFHVAPAHTDGDSVIHFLEANVVHAGDLFFNGRYPFLDLSSGGSFDGLIAAAEQILELTDDETLIIPGHGSLANRQDLVAYAEMLRDVRGRVQALIDQGKRAEEVVAARPTADLDEAWGGADSAARFIGIVYDSLAGDG